MKNLLILLTLSIYFFTPLITVANDFAGGSGTESDPYLVANAVHLDNVRLHLDAHFLQISDISLDTLDFQEGTGWNPIGSCDDNFLGERFTGTYDGNNHEISGMVINRTDNHPSGLFGCTQEASLKRINLTEVSITSGDFSGGLVGYNFVGDFNTIIQESSISGNFNVGENSGGIVGRGHWLTIMDCSVNLNLTGDIRVGGIIGDLSSGEVINSSVSGLIQGGQSSGGGAVGRIHTGNVEGVTVNANITASNNFGGVVGNAIETNISSSSFSGEIISTNFSARIGGIVESMNSGTISNCTTEGYIEGSNAIGGIVGFIFNASIDNCHSSALVVGQSQTGGLAGFVGNCTIANSSFSGTIGLDKNGEEERGIVVGGIVGSIQGGNDTTYITNTSNFGLILGINSVGGIVGVNTAPVKLTDIINEGNISASSVAGGIIGYPQDFYIIEETINRGNVEVQNDFAGGIIGATTDGGRMTNIFSSGIISGQSNIGGVLGIIDTGDPLEIENINVNTEVTGVSNVGGLAGFAYSIRGNNIFVEGEINGDSFTGGIAGYLEFSFLNTVSFNGIIYGRNATGGLFGYTQQIEISDAYTRGMIVSESEEVGGIADISENSNITNTYSTMSLGDEIENNIVSENINTRIINSYFATNTPQENIEEYGLGVSLEEMTYRYGSDIYQNWDFNNIWRHDFSGEINDGLPYFGSDTANGFYYVRIDVNNDFWGDAEGDGYYDVGDQVLITAVAKDDFIFSHWEDSLGNVFSEQEIHQFEMALENVYLTAIFEDPTSVIDLADLKLEIYPNPTSEFLFINSEKNISGIKLYGINGKLVRHLEETGNQFKIQTNLLPQGAYLLAINISNKWHYEKIQLVR